MDEVISAIYRSAYVELRFIIGALSSGGVCNDKSQRRQALNFLSDDNFLIISVANCSEFWI